MAELLNGGLPVSEGAMFLISRAPEPPFERPIDIIAERPQEVFTMAYQLIEKYTHQA